MSPRTLALPSRSCLPLGYTVTRFTAGSTTGWANHANEPSHAALKRSSRDAYDVTGSKRAARRLCICTLGISGWLGSRVVSVLDSAQKARVHIAVAMLSGNSLRQTVHTHRASVHQAAKLIAALLRVGRVTASLAESMAAYRRVYDSRHLQADCQEVGSAPEPYAL